MIEKNKMDGDKTPHWIKRRYVKYVDKCPRPVDMLACSACRAEFSFDYETGVGAEYWNFCPNCGTKMKGDGK